MTLKSALDLLGSAYALHPAFGEASIMDIGAGIRPAFPDNVPRIVVEDDGRMIRVNGALPAWVPAGTGTRESCTRVPVRRPASRGRCSAIPDEGCFGAMPCFVVSSAAT